MYLSDIPQYTVQNRNVHISVLNSELWDMGQVHCEIGLLLHIKLSGWHKYIMLILVAFHINTEDRHII